MIIIIFFTFLQIEPITVENEKIDKDKTMPPTTSGSSSLKKTNEGSKSLPQFEAAVVVNDEEVEDEEVDEDEDDEEEEEKFDDEEFDGISDGDDDDDDTDGLLIPLENGWVCEKRLADSASNSYSTHFWSPDGQRHSSLTSIKTYGNKKKLKLNMTIFERALKNNPHK